MFILNYIVINYLFVCMFMNISQTGWQHFLDCQELVIYVLAIRSGVYNSCPPSLIHSAQEKNIHNKKNVKKGETSIPFLALILDVKYRANSINKRKLFY